MSGQDGGDTGYVPDDPEPRPADGYRTYEVYQRERVGETTNLISPRRLISDGFLTDPYPALAVLREEYPCYRDWVGNRFWITRYDDVTSVLTDDANHETRSRRWWYGQPGFGRDLLDEVEVAAAWTERIDAGVERAVSRCLDGLAERPDLASGFAARLPLELWGEVLDVSGGELATFAGRAWRAWRGAGWEPVSQADGWETVEELAAWFDGLLAQRRGGDGDDLVTVAASLEATDGPVTGADLAVTVLESDHETLHGGLANLWFLLLTHPDQLDAVRAAPRLVKFAWLEALRHSPPVHQGLRFARHEVERFGRLLPTGALLWCSAAAANRDPRAFASPDEFVVERTDLCQREPRGQYRADGLASGIAVALGPPSKHPAEPRERPRSRYAVTRDVATTASRLLLDAHPDIAVARGADPALRSLRLGEMHTCWELPVRLRG